MLLIEREPEYSVVRDEVNMLEKFSQSSGNILGYKILGKITKEDYETLEEDIEGLV